jgi:hypothetical protein
MTVVAIKIKQISSAVLVTVLLFVHGVVEAKGGHGGASGPVYVNGYTKSNGTYVQPHYRSATDGNFSNNWSTEGNVNPYTGKEGTLLTPPNGNPSSYSYPSTVPNTQQSSSSNTPGGYDPSLSIGLPAYPNPTMNYEKDIAGEARSPMANQNNNSWIDQVCPKLLGPSLWKDCVRRETNAINSGMPKLDGLSQDNRKWIDQSCPKLLGPSLWKDCVIREINALR